jgi:hypothetical protein
MNKVPLSLWDKIIFTVLKYSVADLSVFSNCPRI